MKVDDIRLSDEQRNIYHLMNDSGENLFITGKAGTGKSVLLQYFVRHTSKQVAVVAPTGVAALNVGGVTIHSFFKMAPVVQDTNDRNQVIDMGNKRKEILNKIQTLVIDEISMVSVDVMNMIDAKLKYARDSDEPFGGCQIIAFGDLYQLPPVVRDGQESRYLEDKYGTIYFFGADEIQSHPFTIIELQHVFRQKDEVFIKILNKVRLGMIDEATLDDINSCCVIPPSDDQYVTLTGTNAGADRINQAKLRAVNAPEYIYRGEVEGDMKQSEMPTDLDLHLKVGTHIMMIKNDSTDNSSNDKREKARWVNGTLGTVSHLAEDGIKVKINGVEHWVGRETWCKYRYRYDAISKRLERAVAATFTQYPIRLAYAITIHKSQGQTYDAVKIDLSDGAFAPGQTYVALSRCRSMSSLYLETNIKRSDIKASQEVVNYMRDRGRGRGVYYVQDVKRGSQDWFNLRKGKVTGSTAYLLKNHSVSYAISKGENDGMWSYTNEVMMRGKRLEPVGLAEFAKRENVKVETVGFVGSLVHVSAGFSPDGVILDSNGKIKIIIEHKAFCVKNHFACYECVDNRVMYQIQFGMFVTGAKDAYLVLYNPDIIDAKARLLVRHIAIDKDIQGVFEDRFKEYENGEISLTHDSVVAPMAARGGKAVLQCDDDGVVLAEFSSISEASRRVGVNSKSIRCAARGEQKHAGGYVWRYKK